MKLKLDENLGAQAAGLLRQAGHDVETVGNEQMNGAPDTAIFEACDKEQRCLVTLDLDFSDPIRFDPRSCGGIVIIRIPHHASHALLLFLIRELAEALRRMPVDKALWIVEPGHIRVRANGE